MNYYNPAENYQPRPTTLTSPWGLVTEEKSRNPAENFQPSPNTMTSPWWAGLEDGTFQSSWTSPVEDIVNQEETLQALASDIEAEPVLQPMARAEPMMQTMGRDTRTQHQMQPKPRAEPMMQTMGRKTRAEPLMRHPVRNHFKEEPTLYLLGRDIQAEPTVFKGQPRVDIRQWTKDGLRTRKGISLPLACWQMLIAGKHQIQDVMKRMRQQKVNEGYHLGGDIYVTIKSPLWLIDIRYWYKGEDGMLKPGRRGISLKVPEFSKLMADAAVIGRTMESMLVRIPN